MMILFILAAAVMAQPATKVFDDPHVGVRLTVPRSWSMEPRSNDLFVNCAPEFGESGRPDCYFTIRRLSAPPSQKTITDADRAKWKSWVSANGMRQVLSTKDIIVAGFPAHEIIARQSASRSRRVMILIPGKGELFDASFAAIRDDKDFDKYNPMFAKVLETLVPLK